MDKPWIAERLEMYKNKAFFSLFNILHVTFVKSESSEEV